MNKFFLSISLCFITLTGCNNNQADVEEGQKQIELYRSKIHLLNALTSVLLMKYQRI